MRGWTRFLLAFFCLVAWGVPSEATPPFKADQYKDVELKVLRMQPEKFKNKKICYESRFKKVMTTFPTYAERNGFKAGKYYWFVIAPLDLPVVARKTDEMNALAVALESGASVKVYGKIRKFKLEPKAAMLPHYYLELIHLEVLSEPEKKNSGLDTGRPPRRPLPPRRKR